MQLVAHYHWKMPSRLKSKETWITTAKLTTDQALSSNPDAWPVYRSLEMLPINDASAVEVENGLAPCALST